MGQILTGIAVKSKGLEIKLNKTLEESTDASEICKLTNEAIAQTRRLAKILQPVDLEAGGINSALQTLVSNTEKLLGCSCQLKSEEPVAFNDPVQAKQVYRIAQEAITNAIKHGKARKISIELTSDKD
ncbi:MAG: hypothetical protein OEW48_04185 [Phycisphaerae bacterium]|nr:hypothetical protein [Phycisphaerae bacterium]